MTSMKATTLAFVSALALIFTPPSGHAERLARPTFFYTNAEPAGLVKQFVDFTLSPDGQKIVANVEFVPIK